MQRTCDMSIKKVFFTTKMSVKPCATQENHRWSGNSNGDHGISRYRKFSTRTHNRQQWINTGIEAEHVESAKLKFYSTQDCYS